MSDTVEVELTWTEAAIGSEIGRLRQLSSLKQGLADAHGYEGPGWSEHIEGACGELAAAKGLKTYWDGSINSFSRPDLPGNIQVRTRSREYYDLIVREKDGDDDIFLLVTGVCPKYTLRGWIVGRDAKKSEFMANHGGRAPAFFVPQSALRPTSEISPAIEPSTQVAE